MIFKKNTKDQKNEDRFRVLFALDNKEIPPIGSCPDPNDMAAFVEGSLESEKSQAIKIHLNACPECYQDWLTVSSVLDESQQESRYAEFKKTLFSFIDRLHMRTPILIPGMAGVAAMFLIIFIWITGQSPNFSQLVDASYTPNVLTGISRNELEFNHIFILPWERNKISYGFGSQSADSESILAFGAGLWSARHELAHIDEFPSRPAFVTRDWQKTTWSIDYWLGRWSYLLRAVSLSDKELPQEFWIKQLEITEKISAQYAEIYKENEKMKIVNSRLDQIKSILIKSDKGFLDREDRQEIGKELDLLIESLSPTEL